MADQNVAKAKKLGFFGRVQRFFKETKSELKKVSWPTKEQLLHNTAIILGFILIACVILSLLDFAFGKGLDLLIPRS